MALKISFITAIWLLFIPVLQASGASEAEKAAERVALRARIAEQRQEIATLALYAARLKDRLGKAPAPASPVKPPDEKLQEVLLRLDLDKVGMSDALEAVKNAAHIKLEVDWKALHEAGVERNTPVTRHLRNCTVSKALSLILLPDDGSASPLWFGLENGVVSVTSRVELAKHPIRKTYDVKFLLSRTNGPGNLKQAQSELTRVLMQSVAPGSWKDNGGAVGSIGFDGAAMTVTQSRSTLAMVDEFLRTVEDSDLDVGNQHDRQTAGEQSRRIADLRAEVAALAAGLRAAGKKFPPVPVPLDKALARPLPEVKFDGVALADCIDFLRDVSDQQIFVNWKALEEAGIDRNAPVTLACVNCTLSDVVTRVLAGAARGKAATGFDIDDNVLTLSTRADLDQVVLTLNYEIRDLLPAGANPEQSARKLIQSIEKAVEPDTWRANGGALGSIRFVGGQLVVTQSNRVHRLIAAYFEALRHPGNAGARK